MGEQIRVAAEAFSPARWDGTTEPRLIPTRNLVLPDNSRTDGLPVYFEGRLQQFARRVGVVYVCLESPPSVEHSVDGIVHFRGKLAIIVKGPATVQLAFPFRIEKLPPDANNYWEDLRFSRVQFKLPL